MNNMKRMFLVVTLLIAFVGSSFAQANLYDKIIEKAYNLSVEAVEAGKNRKSAYEEYLEKQELEAAKKAEEEALETKKAEDDKFVENCNILAAVAIYYLLEHNKSWVKCYCYPLRDYVWYKIFCGDDNDWWINLAYDNNDEIGDVFYARKNKNLDFRKVKDDISGKETAAIKLTTDDDDHIGVIQDIHDPKTFMLTW